MQLLMNKFSVDNNSQLKYASRWHFLGDKTFPGGACPQTPYAMHVECTSHTTYHQPWMAHPTQFGQSRPCGKTTLH